MKFKTFFSVVALSFVLFTCSDKEILADEEGRDNIVKGRVELVELVEETETRYKQTIKINLLEGQYKGTSMYADYEGDLKLREKDEIYVRQQIEKDEEGRTELRKLEFVGLSRSNYLMWLGVITLVILATIAGKKAFSKLGSTVIILALVGFNVITPLLDRFGTYTGAIMVIAIIVIISNIMRKGLHKFTLIATLGGMTGILLTAILQVAFSDAMRLPIASYDLVNAGVFFAATGIITSNALQIAFGIKENLERQVDIVRTEILNEGVSVSRTISSAGINILMYCYIGLYFTTIVTNLQADQPTGLFNNPQVAHLTVSILASAVGILVVPIVTTILTFFIIDVNNLGRRVPQKRQLSMGV